MNFISRERRRLKIIFNLNHYIDRRYDERRYNDCDFIDRNRCFDERERYYNDCRDDRREQRQSKKINQSYERSLKFQNIMI